MNWIELRRKELGINQDELAARLQVEGVDASRSAVSAWETGRNSLPLKNPEARAAFSRALQLPIREILRRSGFEISAGNHSDAGERAAYIVDELPEEKRRLAIRLLEQLMAI